MSTYIHKILMFISKCILLKFSSRYFMISGLTFNFLIHFEFMIYMVWENNLGRFFCKRLSSFLYTIYWKSCFFFFLIVYSCTLCYRLFDCITISSYLDSLFCSIDLSVRFCVSTILFWPLCLCSIVWNQQSDTTSFFYFYFPKTVLTI